MLDDFVQDSQPLNDRPWPGTQVLGPWSPYPKEELC